MSRKTYTLAEIAKIISAKFVGNPNHAISGVNALETASSTDVSFLANLRYREAMKESQAGVICIHPDTEQIPGKNYFLSENPSRTFQEIAEILLHLEHNSGFSGIHPSAVIHETARIEQNVQISPNAVIDRDVIIGKNSIIGPNVYIGPEVSIGTDCHIHSNAVIRERCQLGNRVILQPGAVIGSCGFGYTQDLKGQHCKLEQLGIVVIEDDVEIGANATIDRARFHITKISRGTKIDNLVQIAHNVEIGPYNILAAQSGVAGSAKTGTHVMCGGQVGILGHVEVGDFSMIATRGGVSKSLPSKGKYRGSPAIDVAAYNRQQVHIRRLEKYVKRLEDLEKIVSEMER